MRITTALGLIGVALSQMGGCPGANLNNDTIVLPILTSLVSRDSSGVIANNASATCSISSDGRYVAYDSYASNLIAGDTNGKSDILLYDTLTRQVELISINTAGSGPGNGSSSNPRVSPDGRYVVFQSTASDLVTGVTDQSGATAGGTLDIFLRDRIAKKTVIVSIQSNGTTAAGNESENPAILVDSTDVYVVFESASTQMATPGGGSAETLIDDDVFVRKMSISNVAAGLFLGTTTYVSQLAPPATAASGGNRPYVGADTTDLFIVFDSKSAANTLVTGANENNSGTTGEDVFFFTLGKSSLSISDRKHVSVDPGFKGGKSPSLSAAVSPDGKYVAFVSQSNNFDTSMGLPGSNQVQHVYRRQISSSTTVGISLDSLGVPGNAGGIAPVAFSSDGNRVVFSSNSVDLVTNDTNNTTDVFLRDVAAGTTRRISVSTFGEEGNSSSGNATISGDGRFVGYNSNATTLVGGDSNGRVDIFLSGPF